MSKAGKKASQNSIPRETKKYLTNVALSANLNGKYRWGIDIFERYRKKYLLDEQLEYELGLLYDHLALFHSSKLKDRGRKVTLTKKYLGEAEKSYRNILKKNPNNLFGWYGMSRVYQARGNYETAIKHALKAYKLLQKRPKNKQGPLAIGYLFQQNGDYKNAEKWYKKELRNLGENNFSANYNLMTFYLEGGRCNKALPYAMQAEKLLYKEFVKPAYKKVSPDNKTLKLIRKRISAVKECAK